MTLDRYLENRRYWEILIVAAFILMGLFANVGIVGIEYARAGDDWERWIPWVLEGTSHAAIAALIAIEVGCEGPELSHDEHPEHADPEVEGNARYRESLDEEPRL